MSIIDTRLAGALRENYLSEVRSWLPAFLAGASVERDQPLNDVSELFGVDRVALRRVVAVHLMRHEAIEGFSEALSGGLRAPATSSELPRRYSPALTGGIDWAATSRARATSAPTEPGYVTRSATRIFDLPENRMLKWAVVSIANEAEFSGPYENAKSTGWRQDIATVSSRIARAQRIAWLRNIEISREPQKELISLGRSRRLFYRVVVRKAAEALLRYQNPSYAELTQLLTTRWFEPERDWLLFEFVILLRIHRAINAVSSCVRLRALGVGRGPFAEYRLGSHRQVRLWYQRWPQSSGPSEMLDAAAHYKIDTSGSRPDIVVEYKDDTRHRAIILELKASQNPEYLAAGLLQLLGYLRDRPALFNARPNAWLVAPEGTSMAMRESDGRDLWVVGSGEVADAVAGWVADGG